MPYVLRIEALAGRACGSEVPVAPRAHEHGAVLEREQLLARLRRNVRSALELV